MWSIIPAAGVGSRIQPLAFSKELLPVGGRQDGDGERPRAVSEYLIERMVRGGADRICIVIAPGKSDIINYFGGSQTGAHLVFVVQSHPRGLCDAVFQALPLIEPGEQVLVGLPDTVWFPADGYRHLPDGELSFLLFPVEHPEYFDAVVTDGADRVLEIQVKREAPATHWIWGAFKLTGSILRELHDLWVERERADVYFGTLINEWLARGGTALGIRAGERYVDVGTIDGYRRAVAMLGGEYEV